MPGLFPIPPRRARPRCSHDRDAASSQTNPREAEENSVGTALSFSEDRTSINSLPATSGVVERGGHDSQPGKAMEAAVTASDKPSPRIPNSTISAGDALWVVVASRKGVRSAEVLILFHDCYSNWNSPQLQA